MRFHSIYSGNIEEKNFRTRGENKKGTNERNIHHQADFDVKSVADKKKHQAEEKSFKKSIVPVYMKFLMTSGSAIVSG